MVKPLRVYTVTPPFEDATGRDFRSHVAITAKQSERAGWTGILVPHNLHDIDPWLVAGAIAAETEHLIPLIAVQPACVPPHTAASFAAAFAAIYRRSIDFNLVAGAREDEMRSIGDALSHDQRYDRIAEYAHLLRELLRGAEVSSREGYYRYDRLRLQPRPELLAECRIFIAGSSPASLRAAAALADVAVTQPMPIEAWRDQLLTPLVRLGFSGEIGIRVGIICRTSRDEAWELAKRRFPETWLGDQETKLKTLSANVWSRWLAELAIEEKAGVALGSYWLGAFRNGSASAPYLVGSYDEVAGALGAYLELGARHILLNGVHDDDYEHTRKAIELAAGRL